MGGMGIIGKLPQGGNPVPGGPAPEMGGRDPLNAILDAASFDWAPNAFDTGVGVMT